MLCFLPRIVAARAELGVILKLPEITHGARSLSLSRALSLSLPLYLSPSTFYPSARNYSRTEKAKEADERRRKVMDERISRVPDRAFLDHADFLG